jgi:hypothetical protein
MLYINLSNKLKKLLQQRPLIDYYLIKLHKKDHILSFISSL